MVIDVMNRLLAIDPSLTCSGWALFAVKEAKLLGVGKVRSLGTTFSNPVRYKDLQSKIEGLYETLELSPMDAVICEAETTMRDPRAAFKVEQVRGIFETLARIRECQVPGRINPRSVHHEVMGLRGKQLKREIVKDTAVSIVRSLYGDQLCDIGFKTEMNSLKKHQDIIDAVLIGHLGVVRLQAASRGGVELSDLFVTKAVRSARKLSAR